MKTLCCMIIAIACLACDSNDPKPSATLHCVWNQAYQENYEADAIPAILAGANDCYVLLDPFMGREVQAAIAPLRAQGNTVGCYFSSGTCEEWREDWAASQSACVARAWDEWPGEHFVNTPTDDLIAVMSARIDAMAQWGCQMLEFDNMDWAFDEVLRAEYGFEATAEEAMAYTQSLCDYAHQLGLKCMAKNTRQGAASFDGVTFESYADDKDWWDDAELADFLAEGKPGVVVHYDEANCDAVEAQYRAKYGDALLFICEDPAQSGYIH